MNQEIIDERSLAQTFAQAGSEFVKNDREGDTPIVRQFSILEEKFGLEYICSWSENFIKEISEKLIKYFNAAHGKDEIGQETPEFMRASQIAFQLRIIKDAAQIKLKQTDKSADYCVRKAFENSREN